VMLSHHERRPTTSPSLVPAARRVELRDPRDGVAKARRCAASPSPPLLALGSRSSTEHVAISQDSS